MVQPRQKLFNRRLPQECCRHFPPGDAVCATYGASERRGFIVGGRRRAGALFGREAIVWDPILGEGPTFLTKCLILDGTPRICRFPQPLRACAARSVGESDLFIPRMYRWTRRYTTASKRGARQSGVGRTRREGLPSISRQGLAL